jgi:hypothetical protein
MVAIKRAIEPYERKKAKERERAGKPCAKLAQGETGRTREIVAGFVGVGRTTLQKAEDIVTAAEQQPEKYQKLLDQLNN